jgi:hypothetical protein
MEGQLDIKEEQEIVMNVADMMIDVFAAESLLLRVERLNEMTSKAHDQAVYDAMLKVFFNDATSHITKAASDAIASFAEGDLLKTFLMGIKRFTKYPPVNVKNARRLVADALIGADDYCF